MKKLFVLVAATLIVGNVWAHEGEKKDKKCSKDKECCKKMDGKECGKKMDKKDTKTADATSAKSAVKKA
jgi:hypothetical protein